MIDVRENVPLRDKTTFQVGGNAEYFVSITSQDELVLAVQFAKERDLLITVIAHGSNMLVADNGISGLVIQNALLGCKFFEESTYTKVKVAAGEVFDELVSELVEKELWGLENLSHIPGSVGATPVQNVGAYGVEIKDSVIEVKAYDIKSETFCTFTNKECQFEYRNSFFKTKKGKQYIIVSVTYQLSKKPNPQLAYKDLQTLFTHGNHPSLSDIRNAVIGIRSHKFPDWTKVGTAGSFFKNPIITKTHFEKLKEKYSELPGFKISTGHIKVPLGWVLDKVCNLRGLREGDVGLYENQALVVINYGHATSDNIMTFAKKIARKVKSDTDIEIEWEITYVS